MHTEIINIKNKKDFLVFLQNHIQDYRNNNKSWRNNTIESFLEGMESWVEDMEGYYENMNMTLPDDIAWKIFADILYAAKMYE